MAGARNSPVDSRALAIGRHADHIRLRQRRQSSTATNHHTGWVRVHRVGLVQVALLSVLAEAGSDERAGAVDFELFKVPLLGSRIKFRGVDSRNGGARGEDGAGPGSRRPQRHSDDADVLRSERAGRGRCRPAHSDSLVAVKVAVHYVYASFNLVDAIDPFC